jgi:hypothetical protein
MATIKTQNNRRDAANTGWDVIHQETSADIVLYGDGTNVESNYVRQPGYGTTTGSANTYILTLNPAPTALVDGLAICAKINTQNTGSSSINVNGLGAKSILDSKGNAMTVGKLKANTPYTMRYNGENFILQGEGASGNATASDLLSGKTASTDAGDIVGALELSGNATVNNVAVGKTFYSDDAKTKLTGTGGGVKRFATGSFITDANGSSPTINSLDFTPKYIFLTLVGKYSTIGYVRNIYQGDFDTIYQTNDGWKLSDIGQIIRTNENKGNYNPGMFNYWAARSSFTITPSGFSVIYLIPNASYTWTAIE